MFLYDSVERPSTSASISFSVVTSRFFNTSRFSWTSWSRLNSNELLE